MGSILYLKEVPPVGGDTLFASMYAAYEGISDSMRRFLCGLTAIHDGARNYEGRRPAAERVDEFPRAEHPVIRTHPVMGREALFVNRLFTTRIVQLRKSEISRTTNRGRPPCHASRCPPREHQAGLCHRSQTCSTSCRPSAGY